MRARKHHHHEVSDATVVTFILTVGMLVAAMIVLALNYPVSSSRAEATATPVTLANTQATGKWISDPLPVIGEDTVSDQLVVVSPCWHPPLRPQYPTNCTFAGV